MPCDDISAVITVVLDSDERLRYYLFEKITCGKIIPLSNELKARCRGLGIDEIAALRTDDLARELRIEDADARFVLDKELDALQSALANYRGSGPDLDLSRYKIESILHAPDSITITQVILEPDPAAPLASCRVLYKAT
jgi:hypothetical protein